MELAELVIQNGAGVFGMFLMYRALVVFVGGRLKRIELRLDRLEQQR